MRDGGKASSISPTSSKLKSEDMKSSVTLKSTATIGKLKPEVPKCIQDGGCASDMSEDEGSHTPTNYIPAKTESNSTSVMAGQYAKNHPASAEAIKAKRSSRKRNSNKSKSSSRDAAGRKRSSHMVQVDPSVQGPPKDGKSGKDLLNHAKELKHRGLVQEYFYIKSTCPDMPTLIANQAENRKKNRYVDVLPPDDTRVTLGQSHHKGNNGYINANFVDGYERKNAYISTQGPLPATAKDFWQMVWEQQTVLIVMTTRATENGRVKCEQYWPTTEDDEKSYGDFIITNHHSQDFEDYRICQLGLCSKTLRDCRWVTHIQFLAWPDFGIPSSAHSFLTFLYHARALQQEGLTNASWKGYPWGPPIIIHCSAGIGRTGTFVTVDIALRSLEDCESVDILSILTKVRSQRALSVQMPEQYVFIHQALLEHLMAMEKLPKESLAEYLKE